VALHEVSTAVELGDAGEILRKGEVLEPARFPPGLLDRRAQVYIDLARGYTQQRKDCVRGEHAPGGRADRTRGGQVPGDRQGDAPRAAPAQAPREQASCVRSRPGSASSASPRSSAAADGRHLVLPGGWRTPPTEPPACTPVIAVLSYRLVSLSDRTGRSPAQIQEREVAGGAR
jgi:hypothetical protein